MAYTKEKNKTTNLQIFPPAGVDGRNWRQELTIEIKSSKSFLATFTDKRKLVLYNLIASVTWRESSVCQQMSHWHCRASVEKTVRFECNKRVCLVSLLCATLVSSLFPSQGLSSSWSAASKKRGDPGSEVGKCITCDCVWQYCKGLIY